MRIIIITFLTLNNFISSGQSKIQSSDIQITYTFEYYDIEGEQKFYPLYGQQVYISQDKILFVPQGKIMQFGSLLMDASVNKRYEINHEEQMIYIIKDEKLNATQLIHVDNNDTTKIILGIKCAFKELKRYNEYTQDTLTYRYWLALSIPIDNVKKYAVMQGNNNTLILDGSLNYLPLRVEQINKNGDKLITEAKIVDKVKIKSNVFILPDYRITERGF